MKYTEVSRLPSLSLNSFHERPFPGVHLDDPDPVHDGPRDGNALVRHFGYLGADMETRERHWHEAGNQQHKENVDEEGLVAKQIQGQPKYRHDYQYCHEDEAEHHSDLELKWRNKTRRLLNQSLLLHGLLCSSLPSHQKI